MRTLLGAVLVIVAIATGTMLVVGTLSLAVPVLWPRYDACNSGTLTTLIDIRGTPSVANPVIAGQPTRINITADGQMAGSDPGSYGTPIPGAIVTLLVNGTMSGSTALGPDSKGYVMYTFPSPGNYTVRFQMIYKQFDCSVRPFIEYSSSIIVSAR